MIAFNAFTFVEYPSPVSTIKEHFPVSVPACSSKSLTVVASVFLSEDDSDNPLEQVVHLLDMPLYEISISK